MFCPQNVNLEDLVFAEGINLKLGHYKMKKFADRFAYR